MSATTVDLTGVDPALVKIGRDLGVDDATIARMHAHYATLNAAPSTADVTRWTTCPDCRHRASVTVTLHSEGHGAWVCDECGSEFVDAFRFSKDEIARLTRDEQ